MTTATAPATMTASAAWAELSARLRTELPEPTFLSFFASGLGVSIDDAGTFTVALANEFCISMSRQHRAALDEWATDQGLAGVQLVSRDALGLPSVELDDRPNPIVEAISEREQHQLLERSKQAVERQREQPPGVITRLLAERGFWSLHPSAQLPLFEVDDLHGVLQVVPTALGVPGTYEASVFTGLLTLWAGGDRAEPRVETSLHNLAELLGLSWSGRTAAELRHAIELLKFTGYRAIAQDATGGWERLFNLLNDVETHWSGPPTTPYRHVTVVFSEPVWNVISQPRILRPVELATLRALGRNRDLAKRLFLFLEGTAMHRTDRGHEIVERLLDARLAGTLGARCELRDLRRHLLRAGSAITDVAPRYKTIDVIPRHKRGLRPGEPRYLLRVVRSRVANS